VHRTGIAPRKDLADPMSDQSTSSQATASPAPAAGPGALRIIGLAAVGIGLAALAGAAFVLSYGGIHAFAVDAGIGGRLARGYPLIFDVLLVVILAAVLALRGAGLPSKVLAWTCLLALLSAAAGADALHAAGRKPPARDAAVTAAIVPWVLVLVAFALLLAMLRQARLRRLAESRMTGRGSTRAGREPQRKPPASALPLVPGFGPDGNSSASVPEPRAPSETAASRRPDSPPLLVVPQQVTADSADDMAGPVGGDQHPAGETDGERLTSVEDSAGPDDTDSEDSAREDSAREDSGREDSGREDCGPDDADSEDSGREGAEEAEAVDPEMPVFHRMWSSPVPPAGE
jgi:hypothetical protein